MTINEIISKHYDELHKSCTNDKAISQGRTEEDILNDVCVTAIRKYKNHQIEEEEGLTYLKKNLAAEKHFQYNRKKGEIVIYMENPEGYCQLYSEPPEID
jgi:hypothetical protein